MWGFNDNGNGLYLLKNVYEEENKEIRIVYVDPTYDNFVRLVPKEQKASILTTINLKQEGSLLKLRQLCHRVRSKYP